MNIRETELKILDLLWESGPLPANRIYKTLEETIGWKRSTTYTVLQKCIEIGFIEREDPGFICIPLVERTEVQEAKISDLISGFFNNSKKVFLSTFLKSENLTDEEIQELRALVDNLEQTENKNNDSR